MKSVSLTGDPLSSSARHALKVSQPNNGWQITVSTRKSYYYWQRKVRKETYALISSKAAPATESEPVDFAELPFNSPKDDGRSFSPDAVMRRGQTVLELSNTISDRLLDRLVEVVSHA